MKPLHGVEDRLPVGSATLFGMQHVLAMFVGIVTPPLLVGRALKLDVAEVAFLVSMSLFTSGFNTFIQVHRFGPFGSGLLSVQGTSFVFVGLAIQTGNDGGLPLIFTMALIGALVPMLVSRFMKVAQRVFPPVVAGSVIMLIGISLIKVGFAELAGGFGSPTFGSASNLLLGLFVLAVIVLLHAFGRGFLSTLSIAIGLCAGYLVAAMLGQVDATPVSQAAWVHVPHPFRYPLKFDVLWLIPWIIAYLTVAIECIGDLTATSAVSGEPVVGPLYVERLKGGVLADGLGCAITSVFGALPKVTFAQNNAVIAMTRVASRSVGVAAAIILMLMGLFPKLAALVSIMPQPVVGGATVIMFAMVAVAGLDIIVRDGFTPRKHFIVAISLALGLGVTMVPDAVSHLAAQNGPGDGGLGTMALRAIEIIVESGLTVGTLSAIVLNAILPADPIDEEDASHGH